MKILITGSTGYIGRNLVEKLGKKYTLYTPSHKELELLNTNAVEKFFKKNPIDVVIHCTVSGGSRKEEQEENAFYKNVRMFFNIIRNKRYFGKMIFLGSGAEYDKSRPLITVNEEEFDKQVPGDEYGFSKYVRAKYIEQVEYITNLRIFGLFGKYEDHKLRFISNAICKNLFGLPITISQNVYFDYVYIDDFVKIVDYFIQHKCRYKFYNIGRGQKIDILTIAEKINEIADRKSDIIVKKKGLKKEYTCDNTRLMRELGDFEFTDFDKSLKELYEWYKSILPTLDKKMFLKDKE